MRTANEIRQHFLEVLNYALARLGMYGGETAAWQFLTQLAFIDSREAELTAHFRALSHRGVHSGTVAGVFPRYTKMQAQDNEIGSVFAEIAFQMGYLATERVLSEREFESLQSGLRKTCRNRDFTTKEVRDEFGQPSWVSGGNPMYPWTFLYLTDQPTFQSIAFDFWNEFKYDKKATTVCGKYGELPVLRNIRSRGPKFSREFTFTPLGRKICKRN